MTKHFEMDQYMAKHAACPCVIRYRHADNQTATPALICKPHNIFLRWLSKDDAEAILAAKLVPVEPWINWH